MQTITGLAVSSIRENRTRSTLAALSIFLTTLLLTAIAVFGYGSVRNYQVNAGRFYGAYYGSFTGVSEEKLADISLRSEFAEIGTNSVVGSAVGEECDNLALYCMDETTRRMTNQECNLAEGRFPETENELAGYRSFFQALGLADPKLGDTVTVRYRKDLKHPYEEAQFVVCGFLEEAGEAVRQARAAFVSSDYYEKSFAPEERTYTMYFTLDKSIPIDGGSGESVIKALAADCGLEERYASDNYFYLNWALNPGTDVILGCAGVALLVVSFAVLVIYNIFQVGIARKVQEYGKIKAIGTTKRQMKRMIFNEGMMLAAIAVPPGLAAGFVSGKLFFDAGVIRQSELGLLGLPVSLFSLPVLLFVALSSFLTVWIALMRPMRIVASVSPVEAMRYQELPGGRKKQRGVRKGRKSMDVRGLMLANLSSHRGRTISTILTMGLSCVLFMVLANLAGNMDPEYDARRSILYGDYQLELDYSLDDSAYPENNLDAVLADNPMNEQLLERIRQIEGVKEVRTRDILFFTWEGRLNSVSVLSKEDFESEKNGGGFVSDFTYEEAVEQQALFYGWSYFFEDTGLAFGDRMEIELSNGSRTVVYDGEIGGAFGMLPTVWAITDQTCKSLGFEEPSCSRIWITCEKGKKEQVLGELERIVGENARLELDSYERELAVSEAGISLMRNLAYTFAAFVAVISFLNMANTLITSIVTRKQEFGVLQAVGMTNAQLNRSLQAEGLLFTVGTVLVTLLVGIPAGYALFCYGREIGMTGLYVYRFPALETLIMVIVLAVFQGILSLALSRNIKKESLIERIRYQG